MKTEKIIHIKCIVHLKASALFNCASCRFFPVTLGTENKSTTSCPRWAFCRRSWTVTLCVWSVRVFPLALLTCAARASLE